MSSTRLPIAVCAAIAEVLNGSHQTLDALFKAAGVPGDPPDLAHHSKWKVWLSKASSDPSVDSLGIAGRLIEEFMDLPPSPAKHGTVGDVFGLTSDPLEEYKQKRERLNSVLEENGFRYFRGGRILPIGESQIDSSDKSQKISTDEIRKPSNVEDLLQTIIKGLPRAIHPLEHRRKGLTSLSFESEYDIQDLLHSQLRPWIADIRPEEFTPSYAGTSTRMDFLLPKYKMVIETKKTRDRQHGRKIGEELIVDIEHYRKHPECDRLWCVIFDPQRFITNPSGLITDLEGNRTTEHGSIQVRIFVCSS